MKKLTRTLKKLPQKQFLQFITFVSSPPNEHPLKTAKLLDYLSAHYPNFTGCSYEDYSTHNLDGKLDPVEFRLRCSYLLSDVYEFLGNEEVKRTAYHKEQALVRTLIFMGEFPEARRKIDQYKSKWTQNKEIDSHTFLEEVYWKELSLDWKFSQEPQTSYSALDDYFESLDKMYVSFQLKYLLPAIVGKRMHGTPFQEERWELCRIKMEKWGDKIFPLARMFFHLIHLNLNGPKTHLTQLIDLINSHALALREPERLNIYGSLQNYLLGKILQGDPTALPSLFQLFQRMEKENLIFGRGSYTEHLVRNIINVSCRLGELAWAEKFLSQNQSKIIQSAGENVWHYISAFHQFYSKNHSRALQLLQQVKVTAHNYRTGHQTLLLRIYYELSDFESVEAVATTFRRYLNRNKQLSERQKDLNRNFISIVQLLAKSKEMGFSPYRKRRIEEFLAGTEGITDRTWLEEKFKELNK